MKFPTKNATQLKRQRGLMSLSDHDVIENELLTYFSKVREGCGNKRSLKPLIGNKVKVKGGCTGMMSSRAEQDLGDWDNVPKLPLQLANLLLSSIGPGYKTFSWRRKKRGYPYHPCLYETSTELQISCDSHFSPDLSLFSYASSSTLYPCQ